MNLEDADFTDVENLNTSFTSLEMCPKSFLDIQSVKIICANPTMKGVSP